jgi:hypothetical protein
MHTPSTPDRRSLLRSDSLTDPLFSPAGPPANGLGNLADELADAWASDDEDAEVDMNFQSLAADLADVDSEGEELQKKESQKPRERDSGVSVSGSPKQNTQKGLTPPSRHRRAASEYDGSDYGSSSDVDEAGLAPGLVARMDAVESLARRGIEDNGGTRDGVVKRLVEGLRDLGGQGGVETGATRLITAHTALSTHLLHQTRTLHSLTYPLFSPLSIPPDPETIEELLPILLSLGDYMPRASRGSLDSLTGLHAVTAELVESLTSLSDSLHMSRQTTTIASRRLKSARELVEELRKEEEKREEGERWLRRGNWGERLGRRECAGVCRDVVGGFEEVCEGWRRRLVAMGEGVAI